MGDRATVRAAQRGLLRPWFLALGLTIGGSLLFGARPLFGQADFRRGDANLDGVVDLADAAFLARFLFGPGPAPACKDAADLNDDGCFDLHDELGILLYLYDKGPTPPAPGPDDPGPDTTPTGCFGSSGSCTSYDPQSPGRPADFALGFEQEVCPTFQAGSTARFDVFATLTTSGNSFPLGPEGWAIGLTAEGARIAAIDHRGIQVSMAPAGAMDLGKSFFAHSELASDPADPSRAAAVSAILLSGTWRAFLLESGTQRIAKITLEADLPLNGDPVPVTLRYADGFQGSGQPVKNLVSLGATSQTPELGTWSLLLRPGVSDCNCNGIPDEADLSSGASLDCNKNGIPDECDLLAGREADCNGNGVPDSCDIASGVSHDCNQNGIPDECDFPGGAPDCNGNGVPDVCDIAAGTSKDGDLNGIPDECDPDCNGNGVPDFADIAAGTSLDSDKNGIPDECNGLQPLIFLGFEGCPASIQGAPGETKTFEVYATLRTTFYAGPRDGVVAWQFGVTAEGARVTHIEIQGVRVFTVFDNDANRQTPDLRYYPFDLGKAYINYLGLTIPSSRLQGGIAIIRLSNTQYMGLEPGETQRLAKVTLEVQLPTTTDPSPVMLRYADGLIGSGQPVNNFVFASQEGRAIRPMLESCQIPGAFTVAPGGPGDCDGDGVPDAFQLEGHDCNQNGVLDSCEIAADGTKDCNGNSLLDECELEPHFGFSPPVYFPGGPFSYAIGGAAGNIALGDLDGDQRLDLVGACGGCGKVSVYTNREGRLYPREQLQFLPASVALGDLDGDGRLDIAAVGPPTPATGLPGTLAVFFATEGSFQSARTSGLSPNPSSVVAADLDRDGDLDLAVAHRGANVLAIVKNLGGGNLAPPANLSLDSPQDFLIAADLDGDGDQDLATVESTALRVSALLNKGNGTFLTPSHFPLASAPRRIAAADLDGDGDIDLAVTDAQPHVLALFNDGKASFSARTLEDLPADAFQVVAADLDGDGHPDLALGHWVVLNKGDGTFLPPIEVFPSSAGSVSVSAAGDLDGDGRIDLVLEVLGGSGGAILFNVSRGPSAQDLNSNGIIDECEAPKLPSFLRGDANGDGGLDLSDAIATLGCLFLGTACPECLDAADSNDDGEVDLSDAILTLGCLFLGSACPKPPFGACGVDPTPEDPLDCAAYRHCP